jgi:hypothetical protein
MSEADETGEELHPDLVQLGLRRPTLGSRVRKRVARDPAALTALAERVGRSVAEGRVACECEDVLVAEIERALEDGASSIAQIVARTGAGTGVCGGARCLDAIALHTARCTGRPARELRAEVSALVSGIRGEGPHASLARISLAYARMADDAFDEEHDDEPEVVVQSVRRGKR